MLETSETLNNTLEIVSAGLQLSFKMSKHIEPPLFMLPVERPWKINTCGQRRRTAQYKVCETADKSFAGPSAVVLQQHSRQMMPENDQAQVPSASCALRQSAMVRASRTVIDLGAEGNFRRFEGVVLGEGNIQEEDSSRVPAPGHHFQNFNAHQ